MSGSAADPDEADPHGNASDAHWHGDRSHAHHAHQHDDKTEVALVPVGENGLEAKGMFKVPAGTKVVAAITLAGKPAINARFEIK